MKLKKIIIKNFRSYYGENCFELSDGLTLVIGDNGDGKTTFFEALEWLFDTSLKNINETNVSEMRKRELCIGESDTVSVLVQFEHNGEKEICKSFRFECLPNNSITTRDFSFIGYSLIGSERQRFDGKILLEECFDTVLRRYCLFKGERELNVFDNYTALKTLVDTFSGIKQFDKYVESTEWFEQESSKLVTRELKKDKKQEEMVKILESHMTRVSRDILDTTRDILSKEKAVSDFESRIRDLEENQDACENLQTINSRIESKSSDLSRFKAKTALNYNALLLDDMWILRAFPSILHEYQTKVSSLSKEERRLQKNEDERIAIEKGKKEALKEIQKLANDATPLPWNLPDKETMQEMIDDEVCKVCGRPAPKGSEQYDFMVRKLNEYLEHIRQESAASNVKDLDTKPLFENEYVAEFHTRGIQMSGDIEKSISKLSTDIDEKLQYVQNMKISVERISQELQEAEDAKLQLLIQNPSLTEEMLDKTFHDYKGLSESSKRAELELKDLRHKLSDLEEEKTSIKEEMSKIEPSNGIVKIYMRVHNTLEKIKDAFIQARTANITSFLNMLENEANFYFKKLNAGDFRGSIRIIKRLDESAKIELYSSNGTQITNPGGAQKTTMYMSVLFAISRITTLNRDEDYPLIFDAPTSSFGEFKEDVFYNIIDQIDKQCVIFTKDLLNFDREAGTRNLDYSKINSLSCTVYRIHKNEGYDEEDLSTIRTITEKIK